MATRTPPTIIRVDDVPAVPWRNGGGVTRELLAWPDPRNWLLRVSVADIGTSGPCSVFPGVDRWFAENTFHSREFGDLRRLVDLKQRQGVTISLGLPTLNEQATVGKVIRAFKGALMDRVPLLDECGNCIGCGVCRFG